MYSYTYARQGVLDRQGLDRDSLSSIYDSSLMIIECLMSFKERVWPYNASLYCTISLGKTGESPQVVLTLDVLKAGKSDGEEIPHNDQFQP